jgi:threonine dehydratase
MRIYFSDTHNVAEGAGAAPLAALLQEGATPGTRTAVILSGGNIDTAAFRDILAAANGC